MSQLIDTLLQSIKSPKNNLLEKLKSKEKIKSCFRPLRRFPKRLGTTFTLTQLIGY